MVVVGGNRSSSAVAGLNGWHPAVVLCGVCCSSVLHSSLTCPTSKSPTLTRGYLGQGWKLLEARGLELDWTELANGKTYNNDCVHNACLCRYSADKPCLLVVGVAPVKSMILG